MPVIIQKAGGLAHVRKLSRPEALQLLAQKLIEEAFEVWNSGQQHIAEELADVLEVVEALRSNSGIAKEELARVQEEKRAKRGGFDQLVYLEETDTQSLKVPPDEMGFLPLFADERPSPVRKSGQGVPHLRLEPVEDPFGIIRFTLPLVPPVTVADGVTLAAKSGTMKLEVRYEGSMLTVSVSKQRPKDPPGAGNAIPGYP